MGRMVTERGDPKKILCGFAQDKLCVRIDTLDACVILQTSCGVVRRWIRRLLSIFFPKLITADARKSGFHFGSFVLEKSVSHSPSRVRTLR